MAKKKAAAPEFKMSELIRSILAKNKKASAKEVKEAVLAKHPTARINDSSFAVAFYNAKRKLFGSTSPKSESSKKPVTKKTKSVSQKSKSVAHPSVDLATLQAAAKFIGEVGNADVALEAIKHVQGLQVK